MPTPVFKTEIINNADSIIISDNTGDYNAITNPGGWGTPNSARTSAFVRAILLDIYLPGTSATIGTSALHFQMNPTDPSFPNGTTTFFTGTDRAYNLTTDPSAVVPTFLLQDGVWKFVLTYRIDETGASLNTGLKTISDTKYLLRTNEIRCKIAKLALGDMDTNNYDQAKSLYDKMVQAFECEEYVLAQDLYEEINDFFADCSPYSINSCGC